MYVMGFACGDSEMAAPNESLTASPFSESCLESPGQLLFTDIGSIFPRSIIPDNSAFSWNNLSKSAGVPLSHACKLCPLRDKFII